MNSASAPFVGSNHGRPDLYVGNTPGTAGMQSMSGAAALQPGGFDPGSFQPRRVVNQTVGVQTNHSVPVWTQIRRFANGSDAYIKKGQFVFLYRPSTSDSFSRVPMENMLNLPMVNYYLGRMCMKGQLDDKTAAAVVDQWTPHGVVLNTQGGDGDGAHQERMLNCTVSGFADTFNVWGGACYDATRLFFVYKKVRVPTNNALDFCLRFNRTVDQVPMPSKADYGGVAIDESKRFVWQVVPVATANAYPDDDVLLGDDDAFGIAVYVGRVNHGRYVRGLDDSSNQRVRTDVNRMVNQPQFTMFVDI